MSLESNLPAGGGGDVSLSVSGAESTVFHAETQLTSHADIAAARSFFQPAANGLPSPAFTGGAESIVAGKAAAAAAGAESTAIAAKAVAGFAGSVGEVAAMGAHAIGGAGAVAGAAEISPMIQLIMKLPGLGGVAQSFFEWLGALFAAPAEMFNPAHWAALGNSLHSGLSNLTAHSGVIGAEHFQVPLSMLPANAPFLHQLSMQAGHGLGDLHRVAGTGLGNSSLSSLNLREHLNVSGPLDLKKPQFEMGQSGSLSGGGNIGIDGKISGPQMSAEHEPSFLAGTKRLFADQVTRPASLFTQTNAASPAGIVSNAASPAGSQLNISSNSFNGPEMSGTPANYRVSDGVISGPSSSGADNIGFHLSDAGSASIERASSGLSPSGAVGDTLGGKELIASNDSPGSFSGSYFKPAQSSFSPAEASGNSSLTELKAEPMSLMKKAQPTIGKVPARGAVDQIGHQSKGQIQSGNSQPAHSQAPMDQVSHRGHGAHSSDAGSKHLSAKHTAPKASHNLAKAHKVEAKPEPQSEAASPEQAYEQGGAPEQTAMQSAGSDNAAAYTVQRGDNLWDIARKQLGDGSRWTEIYKMNTDVIGSNPDLIHSGLELKLPGADTTQITDAGNYTVKPGDNLWDIAHEKLGDGSRWGEIYEANKAVIGDNPRLIFSGQDLQMPGAQTAISQAAPDPTAMQSMPQSDPSAMQMAPQAMAPQGQGYYPTSAEMSQPAPPQVQAQANLSGPGAAAAATLDAAQMPVSGGPVSASLAPDLSFLYPTGKAPSN